MERPFRSVAPRRPRWNTRRCRWTMRIVCPHCARSSRYVDNVEKFLSQGCSPLESGTSAAPPRSVMNSRRCTRSPRQCFGVGMTRPVNEQNIRTPQRIENRACNDPRILTTDMKPLSCSLPSMRVMPRIQHQKLVFLGVSHSAFGAPIVYAIPLQLSCLTTSFSAR